MHLLCDEIKTLLENHSYGYPVSVVREFNAADKVFPRIVIMQLTDSTAIRTADEECVSTLSFQFDIYTKDATKTVGTTTSVVSRVKVADEICQQIDTLIYNQYKMNRDEVSEDYSYANDVARRIMRYSCAIDKSNYTYRQV